MDRPEIMNLPEHYNDETKMLSRDRKEAQRVRRAPQNGLGTDPRRTPFCASFLKTPPVRIMLSNFVTLPSRSRLSLVIKF